MLFWDSPYSGDSLALCFDDWSKVWKLDLASNINILSWKFVVNIQKKISFGLFAHLTKFENLVRAFLSIFKKSLDYPRLTKIAVVWKVFVYEMFVLYFSSARQGVHNDDATINFILSSLYLFCRVFHIFNEGKFLGYTFSFISNKSIQTADSKILNFQQNVIFSSQLFGYFELI